MLVFSSVGMPHLEKNRLRCFRGKRPLIAILPLLLPTTPTPQLWAKHAMGLLDIETHVFLTTISEFNGPWSKDTTRYQHQQRARPQAVARRPTFPSICVFCSRLVARILRLGAFSVSLPSRCRTLRRVSLLSGHVRGADGQWRGLFQDEAVPARRQPSGTHRIAVYQGCAGSELLCALWCYSAL
jgi:hypothetical protein